MKIVSLVIAVVAMLAVGVCASAAGTPDLLAAFEPNSLVGDLVTAMGLMVPASAKAYEFFLRANQISQGARWGRLSSPGRSHAICTGLA